MPNTVKWHQYFAAQSAYLQHNPRRGAACHVSSSHEPSIILHGVKSSKLTIGRGHGSGVQVGRCNPRMSRQHFVIEHKPHMGYTLTVQSPNGVLVDRIMFMAGEHIPLVKGSMIEVLGTKLIFAGETEKQDYVETTLDPVVCSKPKPTPEPVLSDAPTSDVLDTLIRLLANSRKTSMTIPEIEQQLKQDRKAVMELIQTTACIGCIERTGNTADGSPKEHLYYYKPELDANDERRSALSQSRRGARKCALKDTQYYFRIPPKLPNHRTKHSVDHKRKLNGQEHQTKKKRRSKTTSSSSSSSSSHITTTTTLVTSPTTIPATTSPFSLSDDDELSDDGFLTSGDEYDDKELTALFQDV